MASESDSEVWDEKKEKLYSKISLWLSLIVTTALVVGYYTKNPPDTEEVQKMRMFFNEHHMAVSKFFSLSRSEIKKYAATKKHPFYAKYLQASVVEKEKIRALAHISYDYTPAQYWFNMIFLWIIFFTFFWFVGLIIEGSIILVRKDKLKK